MTPSSNVNSYLEALVHSKQLQNQVAFRSLLPSIPPMWSKTEYDGPPEIRKALKAQGIDRLYRHQTEAIALIEKGRHVIVATPTSSGKTLVYNLPVLQRIAADRNSKSLYIFPLKALAQDQLRAFEQLAGHFKSCPPAAAIYDGDTSAYRRRRIRETPPAVILTNPEMLHLSFLAHHRKWADFFGGLQTVVVDEVHMYRGVMGSHVAQLFQRLHRICRYYGAAPTFIFSSATVANPAQLAGQLTGLAVKAITYSGASRGNRYLVFINPQTGPAQAAILLLKAALHRGLRTIVYTRSRRLTELIALWAAEKSGKLAGRISAYRAGFLPAERRDIEARLSNGDLLAVISTSALELGIDIGNLDLCLLVGYPGSVVSTWQRGGRVGRNGQDSALILIAGEDALDQFLMRNPEDFIRREPEAAVVNPANPTVMEQHLPCAAAELPLEVDEPLLKMENVPETLKRLEAGGQLWRSADGQQIYARRKAPHRLVNIRGSGNRPIDKAAAIFILNRLKKATAAQKNVPMVKQTASPKTQPAVAVKKPSSTLDYGVFDLETQHSAAEVGGWHRAHLMKISCAVLYDSRQQRFIDFTENQIPDFIRRLREFDRIVGFNTIRFDYQVLKGYSNFDFNKLNNLDILQEVKKYLGFRLSLAHLAEITLGESKSADGLQALRWWQQGRIKEIIEYCRQDVRITRDLYRYGRQHGHLLFRNRTGQVLRIPVSW